MTDLVTITLSKYHARELVALIELEAETIAQDTVEVRETLLKAIGGDEDASEGFSASA